MKTKRTLAIMIILPFLFMGCGTVPNPPVPPTPSVVQQITSYATAIGSLAKAFLPMAGAEGQMVIATVNAICLLKNSTNDPEVLQAQIQALLQQLWTQIDAIQAGVASAAIIASINILWGYLEGQIANTDASTALIYLDAVITGICKGFIGPA